jgi:hypothetical protein
VRNNITRALALLLMVLAVWAADMPQTRYDSAQNARAKLATVFSKSTRTSEDQAAASALITKYSLTAVTASTFGYLSNATGDNMVAITSGTKNATSVSLRWALTDVGRTIDIAGAGAAGATLRTTIAAYVSAGAVTLTDNASTTVAPSVTSAAGLAVWGDPVSLVLDTNPLISSDGSKSYKQTLDLTSLGNAVVTATGGTTSRTLASRANDWLSVKDYGAAGDGTTYDDAAVVAAIAACPTGGTVYFPKGTYRIQYTIQPNRYLTLRGAGLGATRILTDQGRDFFLFNDLGGTTNGANCVLRDFMVYATTRGTSTGVYIKDGTGFCEVTNVDISGFYHGIRTSNGWWTVINNCQISSCLSGLYVAPGVGDFFTTLTVNKTRIANCDSWAFRNVSSTKMASVSFNGCNFEHNGVALDCQVICGPVDVMTFNDCYFEHSGTGGWPDTMDVTSTNCVTVNGGYFNGGNRHIIGVAFALLSVNGTRFIGTQAANPVVITGGANSNAIRFATTDFDKAPSISATDYTYLNCTGPGIAKGLVIGGSAAQVTLLSLPAAAGVAGTLYKDGSGFVKVSP